MPPEPHFLSEEELAAARRWPFGRALEIRAEEIVAEAAGVSLDGLRGAFGGINRRPRPTGWEFPPGWSNYEALHIRSEASRRLTNVAFKRIVRFVHPDMNPERLEWATAVTKRVNAAWEDVQRRQRDS